MEKRGGGGSGGGATLNRLPYSVLALLIAQNSRMAKRGGACEATLVSLPCSLLALIIERLDAQACWRLGACCRTLRAAVEPCTTELCVSIRPEDDDSWSFLVRSAPIRPEDSGQLTFLDRISLGLARSAPRLLRMLNLRDLQLQGPFNRRVVEIVLRFVPTISRLLLSQFFTWNDLRLVLEDYPDKVHIIRPIGNKPVALAAHTSDFKIERLLEFAESGRLYGRIALSIGQDLISENARRALSKSSKARMTIDGCHAWGPPPSQPPGRCRGGSQKNAAKPLS